MGKTTLNVSDALMKNILIFLMMAMCLNAYGATAVDTVSGKLGAHSSDDASKVTLAGDVIAKFDYFPRLSIENKYRFKDTDVVLLEMDAGGRDTLVYRLVVLRKGTPPYISDEFAAIGGRKIPEPKVTENSLVFNSGAQNGVMSLTTYSDGRVTMTNVPVPTNVLAKEENCSFLYKEIYKPFVAQGNCDNPVEPTEPMYIVRNYRSALSDPGLNEAELVKISKRSCVEKSAKSYAAFKKQACGHKQG